MQIGLLKLVCMLRLLQLLTTKKHINKEIKHLHTHTHKHARLRRNY